LGGRSVLGEVSAISPVLERYPNNPYVQMIRVQAKIANPAGQLKANMTGYAKIQGEERPVILAFSRLLIRFFQVEFWSWIP
jgi:hypothetical protein